MLCRKRKSSSRFRTLYAASHVTSEDVERCVADPVFRNHSVGKTLAAISKAYGIPLFWHPGFTLAVDKVPEIFRDCPVRPLAERIAGHGILDAAKLGAMANSLELEPQAWKGWASYEVTLAQFRRPWHVLVLNGTPNNSRACVKTPGWIEVKDEVEKFLSP